MLGWNTKVRSFPRKGLVLSAGPLERFRPDQLGRLGVTSSERLFCWPHGPRERLPQDCRRGNALRVAALAPTAIGGLLRELAELVAVAVVWPRRGRLLLPRASLLGPTVSLLIAPRP